MLKMKNFLKIEEKKISKEFLHNGYIIKKIANRNSLDYISSLIKKSAQVALGKKKKQLI